MKEGSSVAMRLYPAGARRHGTSLAPGRYVLLYSGGLDSSYIYRLFSGGEVEILPLHAYISRSVFEVAVRNLLRLSSRPVRLVVVVNHSELLRVAVKRLRAMRTLEYTCIVCKVLMLLEAWRFAERIAADGIITGETLGQVASQTLHNMIAIHYYAGVPVYTPLLALDKHEASNLIAGIVEKTPPCTFLPRRPITRADFLEALMVLDEVGVKRLASLALYEELVI